MAAVLKPASVLPKMGKLPSEIAPSPCASPLSGFMAEVSDQQVSATSSPRCINPFNFCSLIYPETDVPILASSNSRHFQHHKGKKLEYLQTLSVTPTTNAEPETNQPI